jgi:DNA repair protein RadD
MSDLFGLWPHQENAVKEIETLWKNKINSVCLQLSTGGGKTRIIRTIVDNHSQSKKIIYVIAHRSTLIKQLSAELDEAGIKHGIIQSGYPYIKYRVQVCSIQTLSRRLEKLPEAEMIIIDECHHAKSNTYNSVIKKMPNAKTLGVTATPQRLDGKPLSDIFQKLVIGPPMRELIDNNYLSEYDYFAPDVLDMAGVHKRGGDFVSSESEKKVNTKQIIGSVLAHYKKYADHKPAIACCVSIAHAESVAKQFVEAGYKARAVHSKQDQKYIDESIEGLKNGTVEILCQCELLGEGVDIKGAVAIIMLRPTASLTIFLQQIGRILRFFKGKKAIILDHVGNWERHGLPDDPREWGLNGIKKDTGESKYKRCPDCLHPVAKSARVCPHCGHQWTETADAVERIPEEKEGTLVSIRELKRLDKNDLIIKIAREARTLKDAIRIAKIAGIDNRGAWHIWVNCLKNDAHAS